MKYLMLYLAFIFGLSGTIIINYFHKEDIELYLHPIIGFMFAIDMIVIIKLIDIFYKPNQNLR